MAVSRASFFNYFNLFIIFYCFHLLSHLPTSGMDSIAHDRPGLFYELGLPRRPLMLRGKPFLAFFFPFLLAALSYVHAWKESRPALTAGAGAVHSISPMVGTPSPGCPGGALFLVTPRLFPGFFYFLLSNCCFIILTAMAGDTLSSSCGLQFIKLPILAYI